MKQMRTLKFDNFKIEIQTINSDSNYNLSVRLLDDKGLVKGTVLKENTSDADILKFFFQEEKDKLSKDDYYKLRDNILQDLVSSGVTSDEDENYKAFDDVLGNHLNVDWESESAFRVGLYDDAIDILKSKNFSNEPLNGDEVDTLVMKLKSIIYAVNGEEDTKIIVPKTTLSFETENDYLEWQNIDNAGNTIYGVTDIYGKHIGDIREEYLTPLWNNGSIISLENPVNKATEYLSKIVKGWNWVALPNSLQEIEPKLVSILIKEK